MDRFDQFSVLFTSDQVIINESSYPIGQLGVDVLNLEDKNLMHLNQLLLEFAHAIARLLDADTGENIAKVQKKLRATLQEVSTLPVLRDLCIDLDEYIQALRTLHSNTELWNRILDQDSEERFEFEEMLTRLIMVGERLRLFRKQIAMMCDSYLDTMKRRSADAYADAYFLFYADMLNVEAARNERGFDQSFPVEVDFVPMVPPSDENKFVIAERTRFRDLVEFLEVEFYRALRIGNAPRRCHNCGKYFLMTAGYNTCYCNNIAPGETERTCRKVGAHKKEAREKASATPAQKEYAKTYNRLKARKQRGKISADEWNAAVAKAQALLDQYDRGVLTDGELIAQLAAL